MAVTSGNASIDTASALAVLESARTKMTARNRRWWHQTQVERAAGWRRKLWQLTGWIVAETKELPEADRLAVVNRLAEIARDLNKRNGGTSSDDRQ